MVDYLAVHLAAHLAYQLDNLLAVMMVDYLVVHLAALMVVMSVVLMDVQ